MNFLRKNNFIIFFLGFICSQKISLGGELFVGEIIAVLFILFKMNNLYVPKEIKPMLWLIIIWVVSQIISDVINDTDIIRSIKGIGTPIVLSITLLACINFFKNKPNIIPYFFIGVAIGLWFTLWLKNPYYGLNPWKWGLGRCIALVVFTYYSYFSKSNKKILYFSFAFFILSLTQSSRSLGGFVFLATLVYYCLQHTKGSKRWRLFFRKKSATATVITIIIIASLSFNFLLNTLFQSDFVLNNLPEEDALKYSIQASSDLGMILGGRSELMISFEAFIEKPFFGHGSWAENYEYVYRYINMVDIMGSSTLDFKTALHLVESDLIPSHSYLMGAIVWGGLFSGLFWLFIFYKLIDNLIKKNHTISILSCYLSLAMLWNILFSPFGANARWVAALSLWIIFFSDKKYHKRGKF